LRKHQPDVPSPSERSITAPCWQAHNTGFADRADVMFEVTTQAYASKREHYEDLCSQARGLLQGEPSVIANAANFSALIYHSLADLNWCGFYLFDGTELVVGPFQGKPACIRIALGRGVCGTAAQSRITQVVRDVNAFDGHIACDAASQSEIVVPLVHADGSLFGVWDVDSPSIARFDDEDRAGMEALCAVFMESVKR
jgi:L-methionine (R)-S-oxide reductase